MSPAIRAGDPVVGGLPGEIVTNFGAPVINKDGTVAVSAATFVSPSARSGIFVGTPGGLAPVALEGQSAPNLPASIAFGSLFSQAIALSNTGRVVFQSSLTGAGVSPANDVAIFAQDSSGSLVLVAREGDSFDVDDSAAVDLRVIESLLVQRGSGGTDGRSRGINDSNQLVFQAAFTDGSQGVFIATLIAPPCLADTNGDGFVTPADFSAWVAAFNTMAPQCDQNGDGLCTPADFSAWVANYNAGCP